MILQFVSKVLYGICWALLTISLSVMSAAVFTQVILRAAFFTTWLQMEDIVIYAFSISIFSGMALAFKGNEHIAITFFAEMLRPKQRKLIELFADLVSLGFMVFLLVYGVTFTLNGMRQFSPLLRIPLGYVYVIVPFTALAAIVFIIDRHVNPKPPQQPSEEPAQLRSS